MNTFIEGRKVKNLFLSGNVKKPFKCFQASNVFKMAESRNVLFERAISLVDHFTGQFRSLNLIGFSLCLCFPAKILLFNAPFFPLKSSVSPRKDTKGSECSLYRNGIKARLI